MPIIICRGCKARLQVTTPGVPDDLVLQGNITHNCGTTTAFRMVGDVTMWISETDTFGEIGAGVPDGAQYLYTEAESCFHAGAPNGAAAMCRASTEIALNGKNFKARNLYEQIELAKKEGALSDIEAGLAHASRLITRDAIHRDSFVELSDVPSMLAATVRILNKLFPLLEELSGTSSSEP